MSYNYKPLLLSGFLLGLYLDEITKFAHEMYVKAGKRKLVITAEEYQRQFIEERRKAMGE